MQGSHDPSGSSSCWLMDRTLPVLPSSTVTPTGTVLTVEGGVAGLGPGGAFVRDGRPVLLGYGLDDIAQLQADGDGEADLRLATDRMGVEALSARTVSCPLAPPWRTRPTVSRRKWAAPRAVLARPFRSLAISTSPVPAATASSGW